MDKKTKILLVVAVIVVIAVAGYAIHHAMNPEKYALLSNVLA